MILKDRGYLIYKTKLRKVETNEKRNKYRNVRKSNKCNR